MREMTSRERVKRALNFQEPDRVPFVLGGCTSTTIMLSAYEQVKKYLGIRTGAPAFMSEALQVVHVEESVARALNIDMRVVEERSPSELNFHDTANDILTDEWGVQWRRPPGGLYYDICNAPLKDATMADLETYPWPDPDHPERLAGVPERARDLFDHIEGVDQ